ncbi:protein lifeguard 2-like isoform X2 [Danio aesculapii]|uniref:protein lifeguard 2-like isoform X2 n=1 Tax=Danio aesculapii TaxID=1142201 RepID=UPI0024BF1BC8|nr:protein lifeguard 2-like isoform X2 [Danio aesculapii]
MLYTDSCTVQHVTDTQYFLKKSFVQNCDHDSGKEGGRPSYGGVDPPGDGEMPTEISSDDQNIRRIFILKMYISLMIQLSVTVSFVVVCIYWRRFPWNLIVFTIFTLSFSYITGTVTSYAYYNAEVICLLAITELVQFVVATCSVQTNINMTPCQSLIFVVCLVVFGIGLVALFPHIHFLIWHPIYASSGAVLFTMTFFCLK